MATIDPYREGQKRYSTGEYLPATKPRHMSDNEWREYKAGWNAARRAEHETEPDYGGVLGADNQVYSDADPGL